MSAGEFKETFIEKISREQIGPYRSIRLDEWKKGDKIYRNWTYINCAPLDDACRVSSTLNAKSSNVNATSRSESMTATQTYSQACQLPPASKTASARKQEHILKREQLDIDREEQRVKGRISPKARIRKQQRTFLQEQLEIDGEEKRRKERLSNEPGAGAPSPVKDWQKDLLEVEKRKLSEKKDSCCSKKPSDHSNKAEQIIQLANEVLRAQKGIKKLDEAERSRLESTTTRQTSITNHEVRKDINESPAYRQEVKKLTEAAEKIATLVNEDPEFRALWDKMISKSRAASKNLRICQKEIGEEQMPGITQGCKHMTEVCDVFDQLTEVVIRQKKS